MKIKYDPPFGILESFDVIVQIDIPVFYFAKNDEGTIFLVYLYSEFGDTGEYEEVILIPYLEEDYKEFVSGNISLLNGIIKKERIYLIKDDYSSMTTKIIQAEELKLSKLPEPSMYYKNGQLVTMEELTKESIEDQTNRMFEKLHSEIVIKKSIVSKSNTSPKIYLFSANALQGNVLLKTTTTDASKSKLNTLQKMKLYPNKELWGDNLKNHTSPNNSILFDCGKKIPSYHSPPYGRLARDVSHLRGYSIDRIETERHSNSSFTTESLVPYFINV